MNQQNVPELSVTTDLAQQSTILMSFSHIYKTYLTLS